MLREIWTTLRHTATELLSFNKDDTRRRLNRFEHVQKGKGAGVVPAMPRAGAEALSGDPPPMKRHTDRHNLLNMSSNVMSLNSEFCAGVNPCIWLTANERRCILVAVSCTGFNSRYCYQLSFSYFEFKIRLNRLRPFFPRIQFLYSNWKPTEFSVGNQNHYTKEPSASGRQRQRSKGCHSCLIDSSWIYLIVLIKFIAIQNS